MVVVCGVALVRCGVSVVGCGAWLPPVCDTVMRSMSRCISCLVSAMSCSALCAGGRRRPNATLHSPRSKKGPGNGQQRWEPSNAMTSTEQPCSTAKSNIPRSRNAAEARGEQRSGGMEVT